MTGKGKPAIVSDQTVSTEIDSKKTVDNLTEPVLTLQQSQGLVNRVYGLRQSALSIAAQCELIAEYLKRKT